MATQACLFTSFRVNLSLLYFSNGLLMLYVCAVSPFLTNGISITDVGPFVRFMTCPI